MRQEPFWRRYARLFGPNPAADVDDELSFHLETKIDDLVAQGWHPDQARLEAVRQFGDIREVQQVGEELGQLVNRRQSRTDYSGEFWQDLQYTLRILRRDRGFAELRF